MATGVVADAFVHNTDLAGTILRAAGVTRPLDRLDGVPLQDVLASAGHGHDRFLPLYVPAEGLRKWDRPTGTGVRTWRYKYLRYADGSEELYDLFTDPSELTDMANDVAYAAIRSELQTLAERAAACRGPTCRAPVPGDLRA